MESSVSNNFLCIKSVGKGRNIHFENVYNIVYAIAY